jgi:hypothetical protein
MSGDIYAPDQLIVANGKEKLPEHGSCSGKADAEDFTPPCARSFRPA